jgi:hypothetical protein
MKGFEAELCSGLETILLRNRNLREETERWESDVETFRVLDRQLHFQKKDTMMRIWELEAELRRSSDGRQVVWSSKKREIGELHEKVEELKVRFELKDACCTELSSLLPAYDEDTDDAIYCDNAFRLQQTLSNSSYELQVMDFVFYSGYPEFNLNINNLQIDEMTTSFTNSADKDSIETSNDCGEAILNEGGAEVEYYYDYEWKAWLAAEDNAEDKKMEADEPIVLSFDHLHQLKMYLSIKLNSKVIVQIH